MSAERDPVDPLEAIGESIMRVSFSVEQFLPRVLLSVVLITSSPSSGLAQEHSGSQVPDGVGVSFLLVLVEEHEHGDAPAVLQYYGEEPMSRFGPIVLVREAGASPVVIQAAARIALAMMERGLPDEYSQLAVPVTFVPGTDRPSPWAVDALVRLRSARPVELPGIGTHRTLSFGVSAGMVRELPAAGSLGLLLPGSSYDAGSLVDSGRVLEAGPSSPPRCVDSPVPSKLTELRPRFALRRAGLARIADGIVVAGIETEGSGWEAPASHPSKERVPGLWSPDGRRLPPPGEALGIARTGVITPVALDESRWALIWGESAPRPPWEGIPPQYAVTHLWTAQWAGEEWGTSRELARAGHIGWEEGHTVRYHPTAGALFMVAAYDTPMVGGEGSVLFGTLNGGLSPIPLPDYPRALSGSFDISESGEVVAAVIARREGVSDEPFHVLFLSSPDEGRTWSDPVHIHTIPRDGFFPSALRLHTDSEGAIHLLWWDYAARDMDAGGVRHLVRPGNDAGWEIVPDPSQGGIPGIAGPWVTGVDQCGRLTLIMEVLGVEDLTIVDRRWLGDRWSEATRPLPGMITSGLFDGVGPDGSWHVGWSGGYLFSDWEPVDGMEAPPLGIWILTP